MPTVFWDCHGVVLWIFLKKEKLSKNILCIFSRQTEGRNSGNTTTFAEKKISPRVRGVSHNSAITIAEIYELWFELLDNNHYSQDLPQATFFLFPKLK